MSPWVAAALQILLVFAALALVHVPLGNFMARMYTSDRDNRVERAFYRVLRIDAKADQRWSTYLISVLAFSVLSILLLWGLLSLNHVLPFAFDRPAMPAAQGFNTAVSFVTNTNWQSYSGESALGYTVQAIGLTVQNFLSAGVGMAVVVALIRGFTRTKTDRLGNFWVDLTRTSFPAAAATIVPRRARAGGRRRHPEPQRPGRCDHRGRRDTDHPGWSGRLPGSDQGARYQRRRVLQRQLGAPVRKPEPLHQPVRDLPAAGHPVLAATHLRPDGRQRQAGPGHPRRDGVPVPGFAGHRVDRRERSSRCRSAGGGGGHGGQGNALRHPGLGAVRSLHHHDVHRRGRLDALLVHRLRWRRRAAGHTARRDLARWNGFRAVRHADPGHRHGVRRRFDGRAHADLPGKAHRRRPR